MSNLPITNRSSDSKSNSFLSSFFGQKALDNFFQDFSSHFPFSKESSGLIDTKLDFVTPKVDIVERKKSYELTAELPGLESKDIKLSLSDDILTISGEKKYESDEDKEDNIHVMERSYGSFQRSFRLPVSVEQDAINANFKKGVIKILLPKSAKAQELQRKIEITD